MPTSWARSLTNVAEITGDDGDDEDSTPDNDEEGEDDQDEDEVMIGQIFDLALIKEKSTLGPLLPGDAVSFTITVYNQGSLDATDIAVVDYIPTGLILNDANWTETGGVASLNTPIASLAAGASTSVDISFTIDPDFMAGTIRNYAEISGADNALDQEDEDSMPDYIPDNDNEADDPEIDEDGLNGGDEDDHDPEEIVVGQTFDLALVKQLSTDGSFAPGDAVSFTITVYCQGSLDATDIAVVDYIPTGLILNRC